MAGIKKAVLYGLGKVSGIIPTDLLIRASQQKLFAPFYHTISNQYLPHIQHLYKVKNIGEFKADLEFLLKHFKPVDYKEFISLHQKDTTAKTPAFLLSFDDGLAEFHDIIAPILIQKGIPAICFLNSAFIDNKDLFYRYKASLLIDHVNLHPDKKRLVVNFFNGVHNYKERLLSINYDERKTLDELAALLELDFNNFLHQKKPYLTNDQIHSLINQGFCFGSHSIDHPEYQHIALKDQITQTVQSTQVVTKMFNLDYHTFSFPFTDSGVSKSFFKHLEKENITDFTFGCAGIKTETIKNHFQRIPFEDNLFTGQQLMNRELLYYRLKQPIGKNVIVRND